MRRNHSLVAPLLFILVGALLLIWNFRPEFPIWETVAKYWPVILIVWGLAKLVAWLGPVPPGAPAWKPSLTVGEFFLALLIVLVGLSASQWLEVRGRIPWGTIDWPWSETYQFTQTLKQPMEPKSRLRVENPAGDVRVTAGDGKEILVTVSKRIRASCQEAANKLEPQTNAEIVREGGASVVRVPSHSQLRADLEITVPRAVQLAGDVRRGAFQASGLEGDVSAEVERGDVTLSNIAGDVRLQLRRGSLTARDIKGSIDVDGRGSDIQVSDITGQLSVRGEYSGTMEFSNVAQGVRFNSSRTDLEIQKLPGRLDMTLGALTINTPGGLVTVSTRNKDVRVEDFAEKVQIVNRGASVELRTTRLPLRGIEVENHSGPIDIAIPAKSEFQIDATTRRGEIDVDFPDLPVERVDDVRSVKGKVGQAGAIIKLTTSYGTISLRKAGEEEKRPEAAPPRKGRRPKQPGAVTAALFPLSAGTRYRLRW